ncbi:MAG: ATP-binding cassette domain-containing protein, partial [Mangrovicoccus sp.]
MIELRKVDLGFGAGPVLRDVSLHLAQGNFFFLTGPSGAGKTTLLRVCAGELQPQNGEVRLFGTPIQEMDRDAMIDARRRLGVVDQARLDE